VAQRRLIKENVNELLEEQQAAAALVGYRDNSVIYPESETEPRILKLG
jgi:hypothetical protein